MNNYDAKYFENLAIELSIDPLMDPFSLVKNVWLEFCFERFLRELQDLASMSSELSEEPRVEPLKDPIFDPCFLRWMVWGVRYLLDRTSHSHGEIIQFIGSIEEEISNNVQMINRSPGRDSLSFTKNDQIVNT